VQSAGTVEWNGESLAGLGVKDIVERGIVLVPEGRRIFPNLTVEENLRLGAYTRADKAGIARDRERVFSLFPRLKERARQKGGTLSGGEQQMLAVGRALMASPKLLMMDEPSLGLAPLVVKMIFEIVRAINASGTTVLLVEQNARVALECADSGYVLETGRITLAGSGRELLADDGVRRAYLGEGARPGT
jgi:branched-chain amino acid transport system ATP-binding protein